MLLLLRLLSTAGWDFAIAGAFLITWISPYALGETAINQLSALMILEFVAVHAGGFMGGQLQSRMGVLRWLVLALLACAYMVLALQLGSAYGNPYPLGAAVGAMVPRLAGILVPAKDDAELKRRKGMWFATAALYVVTCPIALMIDWPRLGITPETVPELHLHYTLMVWGTIYFALVGTLTLLLELDEGTPHAAA